MVKTVVWRKKGLEVFTEMYEYLEKNFSFQAAENFAKAVDARITFLTKYPTTGRKSSIPQIRFANIDEHRHLFYTVEDDVLFVLNIFDNRQHPKKRPY